jgi:hypothetical protein
MIGLPIARSVVVAVYAALHGSAFGTKQTSPSTQLMSAFGGKADMANFMSTRPRHISFWAPWLAFAAFHAA